MFGKNKIPRVVNRLQGPVRIDLDQRLNGWYVYAWVGTDIVLSDPAATEEAAQALADQYEAQLHEMGF